MAADTPADTPADVAVSARVAAPRDRVWSLVGDPARIGEISPECHRIRWLGGATGATPGARFVGYNRKGWMRWVTVGRIHELVPRERLVWDVEVLGQSVARWGFHLDDDGAGGTRVTETWSDRRTPLANLVGRLRTTDSPGHNRRGMTETLARVRRRVEV